MVMTMRLLATALLLAFSADALAADTTAVRGIETGDLDRRVDPCTDFFEFANGAWRVTNPIPPLDGALEPPLGLRRIDQGTAQGDTG